MDPGAPSQVEIATGVLPFLAAGIDPNRPDALRARRPIGDLATLEPPEQIPDPFGRELRAALEDLPQVERAWLLRAGTAWTAGIQMVPDARARRLRRGAQPAPRGGHRAPRLAPALAVTDLRAPALRDMYDATAAPFFVRQGTSRRASSVGCSAAEAARQGNEHDPALTSPSRSRRWASDASASGIGSTDQRRPAALGQPDDVAQVLREPHATVVSHASTAGRPSRRRAARRPRRPADEPPGATTAAAWASVPSVPTKSSTTSAARRGPRASSPARRQQADVGAELGRELELGWVELADGDDQLAPIRRHQAQVLEGELAERPRSR